MTYRLSHRIINIISKLFFEKKIKITRYETVCRESTVCGYLKSRKKGEIFL